MNKLVLPLGLALAQAFAVGAFAQAKGEADPAQSKGPVVTKVSPEDKAAAKAARKVEGKAAAISRNEPDADPAPAGVARKATKEERVAAAAKRKAAAAEALKKGQIPSGEK